MSDSSAWLLSFGPDHQAAIGLRDVLHLIASPSAFTIPQCPFYCHQALIWQEQILPLINLGAWLDDQETVYSKNYAVIVAYRNQQEIERGALLLSTTPQRIQVKNSQSCPLPEQPVLWNKIADACFSKQDNSIPILNLVSIFQSFPAGKVTRNE